MYSHMKSSRSLVRGSAVAALLLALAGSASAQEAPKKAPDNSPRNGIKLVVENHNYLDMHLYWMRDGAYHSLGMVTGLSKEELTIPEDLAIPGRDFQILADPIGDPLSYLTDPIIVVLGQEVDLNIEADLALTSFTIR
jgi:hypothetical protein